MIQNRLFLPVIDYLMNKLELDFTGYRAPMLKRRIEKRIAATSCEDFESYLEYLRHNNTELEKLVDALTINVSSFFRDPLTFEILAEEILPSFIENKIRLKDSSFRVWSAGCAKGEEPYSVAIIIHELLQKENFKITPHIFATDIDAKALKEAEKAIYKSSSIGNIKHRHLTRYFTKTGQAFQLLPEISKMVTFTRYDILDKKRKVPPESIFGNFDLILCRNLLIYFNTDYQKAIFTKLHHALAQNGILILGQAEAPAPEFQRNFSRVLDFSPIYRKYQEINSNET